MRVKNKSYFYTVLLLLIVSVTGTAWYLHTRKAICARLPVSFSPAHIPRINVVIQEKVFSLEIDLGSKFPLTLNKDLLEEIDNRPNGTAEWRDIRGNRYVSPAFLIPRLKLGEFVWEDVMVRQARADFTESTVIWRKNDAKDSVKRLQGVIGRPLLEKINLLLDFSNSIVLASNNKSKLKEQGYNLDDMNKIPCEMSEKGIILSIETDIGTKRFDLDTGATVNFIRTSDVSRNQKLNTDSRGLSYLSTSKFVIDGTDFGRTDLFLVDITPELQVLDGTLGMDFIERHIIYIDYPNQVLYIKKRER